LRHTAIAFQFSDIQSANLAHETLQELGYEPVFDDDGGTRLHIHVENADLTSALEIAQAFGGDLQEQSTMSEMPFDEAYQVDGFIAVPAHVVNEDWVEGYADASSIYNADNFENLDLRNEDHLAWYDETTDHFSGEVKS
jgi:hypothetical protein